MKIAIVLILFLSGCASNEIKEPTLHDILMQHDQDGYFTAEEYLEGKER